jgi:hypothetical protein
MWSQPNSVFHDIRGGSYSLAKRTGVHLSLISTFPVSLLVDLSGGLPITACHTLLSSLSFSTKSEVLHAL